MPRLRPFPSALAAGLTILFVTLTPARAEPGPTGWWLDESRRAAIRIEPCGDALCGHIGWLREPLAPNGQPMTDARNADPARRARPLCGLPMLWNFRPSGPGEWSGGFIYNPEDGETYRSTLRLAPDGTLRVRGYVGVPLLGKSQTWTRPPESPPPCSAR